jgi:hypothetical protein
LTKDTLGRLSSEHEASSQEHRVHEEKEALCSDVVFSERDQVEVLD